MKKSKVVLLAIGCVALMFFLFWFTSSAGFWTFLHDAIPVVCGLVSVYIFCVIYGYMLQKEQLKEDEIETQKHAKLLCGEWTSRKGDIHLIISQSECGLRFRHNFIKDRRDADESVDYIIRSDYGELLLGVYECKFLKNKRKDKLRIKDDWDIIWVNFPDESRSAFLSVESWCLYKKDSSDNTDLDVPDIDEEALDD